MSVLMEARAMFRESMCDRLLGRRRDRDNPERVLPYSNADSSNTQSKAFAEAMAEELMASGLVLTDSPPSAPQTVGKEFSDITSEFLRTCFQNGFKRLRPADWDFKAEADLPDYVQYSHIGDLQRLEKQYREGGDGVEPDYRMAAVVAGDYHVSHDVLMFRKPEEINELNELADTQLLTESDAACLHTPLLRRNQGKSIVHAAVSTKWTLRSDRAQNVRTEALNLQKHRKGRTPHLVAVTAEPLPSRLSSLAVGTGEIDCVYHVALAELVAGVKKAENVARRTRGLRRNTVEAFEEQLVTLMVLVDSRQLRDIADLPFDLVI